MANTVTLQELQARALDYADMTGSSFPDTGRLTDYINSGLSDLHEMLVHEEYFRTSANIAVVSGTEEYDLPADFYKAMKVYRLSSGRRYLLDQFNPSQLSGYRNNGPAWTGTVELWYAPSPTKLVDSKDPVNAALPIGWDDFIALHAATRLLIREQSDPSAVAAEREQVRQRIMDRVEPRDIGTPDTIEDHYGRWGGGLFDIEERALRYRIMGSKILFVEFGYLGV